jgi:UDPglucose--hexose-1-phosphate uridylyltransferase
MSILRYDPTTSDWVIFAPARARRPHQFKREPLDRPPPAGTACPFCPGNERLTPPEIDAIRQGMPANTPGWQVRVVPNMFPALRIEEENTILEEQRPFFRYRGGCGAHEVIIESPVHDAALVNQPVEHIEAVLRMMQARHNDLFRDDRFQTVIMFKNHGEGAGTSLVHSHSQLIATPVVPHMMRQKLSIAADYFDMTGQCLYCVLLEEELAAERRVLAANSAFAAILPYASHVPFEVWILPRSPRASFGTVPPDDFRPLAELLKLVLLKLFVGLENPDFNMTIDTVPRGDEDKSYFLWHIQILPRLTTPAGFEMGSGMAINTVLPEEAAQYLRQVAIT